jgi:hypothetical protein
MLSSKTTSSIAGKQHDEPAVPQPLLEIGIDGARDVFHQVRAFNETPTSLLGLQSGHSEFDDG